MKGRRAYLSGLVHVSSGQRSYRNAGAGLTQVVQGLAAGTVIRAAECDAVKFLFRLPHRSRVGAKNFGKGAIGRPKDDHQTSKTSCRMTIRLHRFIHIHGPCRTWRARTYALLAPVVRTTALRSSHILRPSHERPKHRLYSVFDALSLYTPRREVREQSRT